jgi:hypothetical protein
MAVKALAGGTADEEQQKRALGFIVQKLCRINRVSADPESERATYFTEGKRYVGLALARIVATNPDDLKHEAETRTGSDD